jgi:hypothetical protein
MNHTINFVFEDSSIQRTNMIKRFMNWVRKEEPNRIGWAAFALMAHGCVITPLTIAMIIISGNFFPFWILAILAMAVTLITNLAALPTRYTIPVFFLSILTDLLIIVSCLFMLV